MEETNLKKPNNLDPVTKWRLASLAGQLGFIIALPLVAFGFFGKWLDGRYETEPLFVLLGIAIAITSTTVWLTKKFKEMLNK